MSDNRDDNDELENAPNAIRAAANVLRDDVSVRPAWRDALLAEVASLPQPSLEMRVVRFSQPRTISIRPVFALAACAAAMLIGASGTALYMQSRGDALLANVSQGNSAASPVALRTTAQGRTTIRFALVAPGAAHVSIVGDFNGWNASATPMRYDRNGNTWLVDMPLSAGRHLYAFVVDGDLVADPSAARVVDDDFGVQNSVVFVGAS